MVENQEIITVNKVVAVCTSRDKGTTKTECSKIKLIENFGIETDSHAEAGIKRQVSFLIQKEAEDFIKDTPITFKPGIFAENILLDDLDSSKIVVGNRFSIKDCIFEISQIGKECHQGCQIQKITGRCIMPQKAIFATVIKGGEITKGDTLVWL